MTADRETPDVDLTLRDLAILVDELGEIPVATSARLSRFVAADPRCQSRICKLEAMAQDAALAPDVKARLNTALTAHHELDQLLATEGWEHAAQVLDPTGEIGVDLPPLIAIAKARASQVDDPSRLRSVQQRLERDAAIERAEEELVERFVDGLLARDPDVGSRMFNLARAQYRHRARQCQGD